MMQRYAQNMLLPTLIGAAVLVIAFTLLTIVARSPYTHSNLNTDFDPRYTRTDQIIVGASIPFGTDRLVVPPASDQVELGKQLFIANSCASCHGLDGRGGIVGPPISGTKAEILRTMMQVGSKGMPAYASGALTDADLAAVAAYLDAMAASVPGQQANPLQIEDSAFPSPTPLPQPTALPTMAASVTSAPSSRVAGSPTFSGQMLPLLQSKCSACHSPDTKFGGWDASSYESVMTTGDDGPVVIPGDVENSLLAQLLQGINGKFMPPFGPLPQDEIQAILDWIAAGANND